MGNKTEKVKAILASKSPEEKEMLAQYIKQQSAMNAFNELKDFLSQVSLECDMDGLVASIACSVIHNSKQGFKQLREEKGDVIHGFHVAQMCTYVLRKIADNIEAEALLMVPTQGGIQ